MTCHSIPTLSFNHWNQDAPVTFTCHRIAFPVAWPCAVLYSCRSFINHRLIWYSASTFPATIALVTLLLTAQIVIQLSSLSFVSINILINPCMADSIALFCIQAPGDLFWRPITFGETFKLSPVTGKSDWQVCEEHSCLALRAPTNAPVTECTCVGRYPPGPVLRPGSRLIVDGWTPGSTAIAFCVNRALFNA